MRKRITVRKKSTGEQIKSYVVTKFLQYRNLKEAQAKDDSIYIEEKDVNEIGMKVTYRQRKYNMPKFK